MKQFIFLLMLIPFVVLGQDSLYINVNDTVIVEIVQQNILEDGTIDNTGVGLYTLETRHEDLQLWDVIIVRKSFAFSGDEEIDLTDVFLSGGTYMIRAKVERLVATNTPANQILSGTWSDLLYVIVEADDIRVYKTVKIRFFLN